LTRGLGLLLLGLVLPASAPGADVVTYVELDALGSVRVVTDDHGKILERHDYLPFGEECTTGPCASNPQVGAGEPRKFTGKERDADTGLDYFGARYYGSRNGRFTTVDPAYTIQENLVDPQRWNRYAYGRNNPIRFVDPDGKVIFDYQAFKGYLSEAGNFGQEGHGYIVPSLAGMAAAGSVANDVLLAIGVGEALQAVRGGLAANSVARTGLGLLDDAGQAGAGAARGGVAAEAASAASRGETRFTAAGRRAHAEEPLPPGFERDVRLPSGKRMDGYNATERQVIEIKPNNARAIRRGARQVEGYCRECDQAVGPGHTGRVQTYDTAKYLKEQN
jgi:RHS repeat-associated protein